MHILLIRKSKVYLTRILGLSESFGQEGDDCPAMRFYSGLSASTNMTPSITQLMPRSSSYTRNNVLSHRMTVDKID